MFLNENFQFSGAFGKLGRYLTNFLKTRGKLQQEMNIPVFETVTASSINVTLTFMPISHILKCSVNVARNLNYQSSKPDIWKNHNNV
ncbi:CLUMA_CG015505, isoform A [Clunio marinus]|uniref:CLUMA_CG015505, isoform A n=1 Tax=Clunio marinus TaxID=568069 RepID=A0A1J1IQ82_9DIPT|nr:CLUMA_CG015505, isoform A [Clunio marinus]